MKPRAAWLLAACSLASLATVATGAAAQDAPAKRTELRVCQEPNNLPFSNTKGEGIENRIAEVFGKALNLPVTYYSFPQRLAFIRNTLQGFKTWRSAACDRCHGANQEGLVGPSLITSLKTLTKDEFVQTVSKGRPNTQMIAFSGNAEVMKNIDQLYAYLKGRSYGAITKARVEAMQ